jgi:hypothetical protein
MGHKLLSVPVGEETSGIDRTEAASERAAVAMEGKATLLEQAHQALAQRLTGPPETSAALPDQAEATPARNGRRRIASA